MTVPLLQAKLDGPIGDPGAGRVARFLAVVLDPLQEVGDRLLASTASSSAFQTLTRTRPFGERKASCAGVSESRTSDSQVQSRFAGSLVQSGGWPTVRSYRADV